MLLSLMDSVILLGLDFHRYCWGSIIDDEVKSGRGHKNVTTEKLHVQLISTNTLSRFSWRSTLILDQLLPSRHNSKTLFVCEQKKSKCCVT